MGADVSKLGPEPKWIGDALVVLCAKCGNKPGARYSDGSGVCPGCKGTGYRVLAMRGENDGGA